MPVNNVGGSNIIRRLETATSTSANVNVSATATQIVAANNDRTCLYVVNTGSEWATVDHKATPTYGAGIMISPNGGAYTIESSNLDKRLLYGICATGKSTTLAVYEGTGEEVSQT